MEKLTLMIYLKSPADRTLHSSSNSLDPTPNRSDNDGPRRFYKPNVFFNRNAVAIADLQIRFLISVILTIQFGNAVQAVCIAATDPFGMTLLADRISIPISLL